MISNTFRLLIINPGSTSTKLALFEGERETTKATVRHSAEQLAAHVHVVDQVPMRLECVRSFIEEHGIEIGSLDAIAARGGLLRPVESGTYRVDEAMLAELKAAPHGEHASNVAAILGRELANEARGDVPVFVVDPVVVDELADVARYSGLPEAPRRSTFHALNHKAAAREAATQLGREYERCNLIVAHLGGGISVGAHEAGRVVDVSNALDGEGPFSPERAGGLPTRAVVKLALHGGLSEMGLRRRLAGRGGVVAYLGTNDMIAVDRACREGDAKATAVLEAMAYQTSQTIAMHGATLAGKIDAVVLTGGLTHSELLVELVRGRVEFLAPVVVIKGEREMLALAQGALAVLAGRTTAKVYGER